jgi:hypothetical protein
VTPKPPPDARRQARAKRAGWPLATLFLPLALAGAGDAHALGAEFGRCRHVVDATARLACYDAIPYGAAPPAGAASASPAATRPASQASAARPAPDRFGLVARHATEELQSITSAVGADFFGWGPNERIQLENGQVWEVVDGSAGSVGPAQRKVTVRRGALGSFFLDFEGLNISPRVRRIR